MFQNPYNYYIILLVSFALATLLTYAVREAAHKFGFVAKPKSDRWHKRPTAMLGGVAIYLTVIISYLLFVPKDSDSMVILAGSSVLFLVGLIDDILQIKPYQKLIGQFIGVAMVVGFGLVLPWTNYEVLNIAITCFWLIGITNAINLLDNMDGLSAGIAAIAAISLAAGFGASGQFDEMSFLLAFIGALGGFLVFNFNPASIFMGDCGSMFVGFLLSSAVLLTDVGGRSRGLVSILAVPALILFVPIFDTTFVTVLRKIWGRKASQGGRDHTSHRLVALGLSERSAVLLLYGLAFFAGLISFFVRELEPTRSIALILIFTLLLTIIGVYLAKVQVYEEQQEELALQNKAAFGFLLNLSHKRRIFEVVLDAILIGLAYYAAYILILGAFENSENWSLFRKSLPILIVLKLFAFLVVGVYRGIWRYTSIRDFVTFLKAVAFGSILSVLALLLLFRFEHYSRTVFIVDAILMLLALAGSRMAFRLFRQILPMGFSGDQRRVLIYGAGDGGEMVLRELKNNPEWNYQPIGFLDDNPLKEGKVINGLKVYGGDDALKKVCRDNEIHEILISARRISDEKVGLLREICLETDVSLKRAVLKIEPVDFE